MINQLHTHPRGRKCSTINAIVDWISKVLFMPILCSIQYLYVVSHEEQFFLPIYFYFSHNLEFLVHGNLARGSIQGCAIVETGSRYQYQYSMTLGCNTNININNKRSGFATSIPISILVQLIQQYQYWYQNHFLQICNINFNNNIKSLILSIPITPQYHFILQYLGININIWINNSTIKWLFRHKFCTF